MPLRSKYDALVAERRALLRRARARARAPRAARTRPRDVLIDEFQVKLPAIGDALSKFFGVPYEPFKPDRVKPLDLLRNLKREFCETNQWVPLARTPRKACIIMTPTRSRRAPRGWSCNVFPKSKIVYTVTTHQEFNATLDQLFGAGADGRQPRRHRRPAVGTLDEEDERRRRRRGRSPRGAATTSW